MDKIGAAKLNNFELKSILLACLACLLICSVGVISVLFIVLNHF